MKKVAIIGAGFSGLSLAWALHKRGVTCEVFEKENRCGGMIATEKKEILIESAANAVIASAEFEALCADVGVELVTAGFKSNARYIFRNLPKRFPLGVFGFFKILFKLFIAKVTGRFKPLAHESVRQWGTRLVDSEFVDYLIEPALQGIYAVPTERLNAKLVIDGLLDSSLRPTRGKLKGSVSPTHGMGELMKALSDYLQRNSITIHYGSGFGAFDEFDAVVYAGSLRYIGESLGSVVPKATGALAALPLTQVSTVVLGFKSPRKLRGFGCLFPRAEGFHSLGVLFNTDIFPNRGDWESESWIFASAEHGPERFLELALADRRKLTGLQESPEVWRVNSWKPALPVYGPELKELLKSPIFFNADSDFSVFKNGARLRESAQPLYLTGNFLGGIGLARILKYNLQLAQRIESEI